MNAEPVTSSSAPSPTASLIGVSFPMTVGDILYLEPGIRTFAFNVVLNDKNKPVPAAIETANRIGILGLEIRPEIGMIFKPDESMSFGFSVAPSVILRFPIVATGSAGATEMNTVRDYYFSKARYFNIYGGAFFGYSFYENLDFKVKLGTNFPVYHLWDGEQIAFYDQLLITPEIALVWRP